MTNFSLRTKDNQLIRFRLYENEAPATCEAFLKSLPFSLTLIHARVSGEEIWSEHAPELDIIQENASVFTEPGEIVIGPMKPARTKTAGCIGIYYGNGKGLDCCNIFGKVFDEDKEKLKELGNSIWSKGAQRLTFEASE